MTHIISPTQPARILLIITACCNLLSGCGGSGGGDGGDGGGGGGGGGGIVPAVITLPEITAGPSIILDPLDFAPLTAEVTLTTDVPTTAVLTISDGSDSWTVEHSEIADSHVLPVLGLKPNTSYTVEVTVVDGGGDSQTAANLLNVITAPLPVDFPVIEVTVSDPENMEPGYTFLDQFRRLPGEDPSLQSYAIILDHAGAVVWYAGWPAESIYAFLNGMRDVRQLENGKFAYVSTTDDFVQQDLIGTISESVRLVETCHHDIVVTDAQTYLCPVHRNVTVDGYPTSHDDPNAPTQTVELLDDLIIEFAADGSFLNQWSLIDIVDVGRVTYRTPLSPGANGYDWAHINAVVHDPSDDTILVSPRFQNAIVKFGRDGSLKWILSAHSNWNSPYSDFLLDPIGIDFDWQYGQHSHEITPSGTIMIFDNGDLRADPFDGTSKVENADNYSRAVEYAIDETNMEVSKVWEFALMTPRQFSIHMGDADTLPITGNVLIDFPGIQHSDGAPMSDLGKGFRATRLLEVTHDIPATVVFDALIYNPDPTGMISVYRTERISSLYGPNVIENR